LEDLAGREELVKIQILTYLRVIRDSVHVAPKKAPGFLGYSSSSFVLVIFAWDELNPVGWFFSSPPSHPTAPITHR
jgi:hypothetical protein